MEPLTDRQAEVLWIVCRAYDETGRPPTQSELARELGCSRESARQVVLALEKRGRLTIEGRGVLQPLYYPDGAPFQSRPSLLAERLHLLERVRDLERQKDALCKALGDSV